MWDEDAQHTCQWFSRSNLSKMLAIEMNKAGLVFAREIEQTIFYEGTEVGTR